MKPRLELEVLEWASETEVLRLRFYGQVNGRSYDEEFNLMEPITISEAYIFLAKANKGAFRS